MKCPTHPARPFQNIVVSKFITPNNPRIQAKAREIIGSSDRTRDGIVVACFNFVSEYVEYVPDKWQHGWPEWWLLPEETLREGIGDCEDSSFLLDSLILSAFYLSKTGGEKDSRVAIGVVSTNRGTGGHAWVESLYGNMGGWHILESTSDSCFEIGKNAVTIEQGYQAGYKPEWYIYLNDCEQASRQPLYKHYPIYRPGFGSIGRNLMTKVRGRVSTKKKLTLESLNLS